MMAFSGSEGLVREAICTVCDRLHIRAPSDAYCAPVEHSSDQA